MSSDAAHTARDPPYGIEQYLRNVQSGLVLFPGDGDPCQLQLTPSNPLPASPTDALSNLSPHHLANSSSVHEDSAYMPPQEPFPPAPIQSSAVTLHTQEYKTPDFPDAAPHHLPEGVMSPPSKPCSQLQHSIINNEASVPEATLSSLSMSVQATGVEQSHRSSSFKMDDTLPDSCQHHQNSTEALPSPQQNAEMLSIPDTLDGCSSSHQQPSDELPPIDRETPSILPGLSVEQPVPETVNSALPPLGRPCSVAVSSDSFSMTMQDPIVLDLGIDSSGVLYIETDLSECIDNACSPPSNSPTECHHASVTAVSPSPYDSGTPLSGHALESENTVDVLAVTGTTITKPELSLCLKLDDENDCADYLPPSSLPSSQVSDIDNDDTTEPDLGLVIDVFDPSSADHQDTTLHLDPASSTDAEGAAYGNEHVDELQTYDHENVDYPSSSPPSCNPSPLSSSPRQGVYDTPPSSSPPVTHSEDQLDQASIQEVEATPPENVSPKRSLELDPTSHHPSDKADPSHAERPSKRTKYEAPNHMPVSSSSQAPQHKKLSAPFRSPIIKGPLVSGGLHALYATGRPSVPVPPPRPQSHSHADHTSIKPLAGVANKDRTASAAKQFKSPLQLNAHAPPGYGTAESAGTRPTATAVTTTTNTVTGARSTIQALQSKVQILKQAIRIKAKNAGNGEGEGDEDDALEGLVHKWTAAGREVAWAVWDYVKDLDPGTAAEGGMRREGGGGWFADDGEAQGYVGQKRGYGYDDDGGSGDGPARKRTKLQPEAEGGAMEEEEEEEEAHVVQHTLGVMLRRLGIDPATLGWDEEEGDFVDA